MQPLQNGKKEMEIIEDHHSKSLINSLFDSDDEDENRLQDTSNMLTEKESTAAIDKE